MAREDSQEGGGLAYTLMRFMVGSNLGRARNRMIWAWVAGFFWAFMGFFNALTLFFGVEASDRPAWSMGQFVFVLVEAGVLGTLSYGLKHHSRGAAVGLFFVFCISRIVSIAMGLIVFTTFANIARFMVQLIFAYLFFQGIRGAMTFHYLTHPDYPEEASQPELAIAGTDAASGAPSPEEGE